MIIMHKTDPNELAIKGINKIVQQSLELPTKIDEQEFIRIIPDAHY